MRSKLLIQIIIVMLSLIMLLPISDATGKRPKRRQLGDRGDTPQASDVVNEVPQFQLPENFSQVLSELGAQVRQVAPDGWIINFGQGQVKQIVFGPNESWLLLGDRSDFRPSPSFPQEMIDLLREFQGGEEIKQIAFAPHGNWIVLLGRNDFRTSSSIPQGLINVLQEIHADEGGEIKQVAFGPKGGWIILWGRNDGQNGFVKENIPQEMFDRLREFYNGGAEIKQVIFAPNGGWIILLNRCDFFPSDIPQEMVDILLTIRDEGAEIKQVAFAPNSAWIILWGN